MGYVRLVTNRLLYSGACIMIIKCSCMAEFIECIAGMVREGCTFEADSARLHITLTGGY